MQFGYSCISSIFLIHSTPFWLCWCSKRNRSIWFFRRAWRAKNDKNDNRYLSSSSNARKFNQTIQFNWIGIDKNKIEESKEMELIRFFYFHIFPEYHILLQSCVWLAINVIDPLRIMFIRQKIANDIKYKIAFFFLSFFLSNETKVRFADNNSSKVKNHRRTKCEQNSYKRVPWNAYWISPVISFWIGTDPVSKSIWSFFAHEFLNFKLLSSTWIWMEMREVYAV